MYPFMYKFSLGISFILLSSFFSFSVSAQSGDPLTITVVNETDNEPLIGAYVVVLRHPHFMEDSGASAITEFDGTAVLEGLNGNDKLRISYVGFDDLEIEVADARKMFQQKIKLKESIFDVITVTYKGPSKFEENQNNVTATIQLIEGKTMEYFSANTTAKALQDADVYIQKSQAGGGSPVIRGFEANKVLIVVDGVRLNNAIYRNGHLQNVITVDNAMLKQAEVIYGPAAVVYGSDALGGVLYLETKDPYLVNPKGKDKDSISTNTYVRYSTVNNETAVHLDFQKGGKKLGSITSVTYTKFNDIRAGKKAPNWRGDTIPEHWLRNQYVAIINGDDIVINNDNPYLQKGTDYQQNIRIGYQQFDILQKFKWRPRQSLKLNHTLNFQISTSNDIQRYDKLTERKNGQPKFAEWYYGPQKRFFASHKANIIDSDSKLFSKAIFITAAQIVNEDRHQRKRNNILEGRNFEDVYIGSFNMDFKKNLDSLGEKHVLFYGSEVTYNYVKSTADEVNINTGETFDTRMSRYGNDGNRMATAAAYLNYRWDVKRKNEEIKAENTTVFRLLAGLRYTYASISSNFIETPIIPELPYSGKIGISSGNLTGAVGLSLTPWDGFIAKASFSTGYRTPNVDDFSKFREKDGFVTIPNPELKPEYAINAEFNIGQTFRFGDAEAGKKKPSSLTVSGTYFYTHLFDAIVRNKFQLPDGDTLLNFDGESAVVVANVNAAKADIKGYSLNLKLDINDQFFFKATYNDIKGNYTSGLIDDQEINEKRPLSHIPPAYGQVGMGYKWKNKKNNGKSFRTDFVFRYNGVKPLEEYDTSSGNSDNLKQGIPDFGSPAWHTFNFYASWKFTRKFGLNFTLENIANLHYRPFASGISAPGRNFIFTLSGNF